MLSRLSVKMLINKENKNDRIKERFFKCMDAIGLDHDDDNILNVVTMITDDFDKFMTLLPPSWKEPNTIASGLNSVSQILKCVDIAKSVKDAFGDDVYKNVLQILSTKQKQLKEEAAAAATISTTTESQQPKELYNTYEEDDDTIKSVDEEEETIVKTTYENVQLIAEPELFEESTLMNDRCVELEESVMRLKCELAVSNHKVRILTNLVDKMVVKHPEYEIFMSSIHEFLDLL